ncbi:MAG: 4-(cytidine 5'-diphospho)-2-C-methyl-D-erythritol kinase [Oscillospiraceae bacterium]|nr:4-(cytidine 5'-diphospho)-2-C-methyl-D-erythritol kinase [Oscillospiraceae bacterium]
MDEIFFVKKKAHAKINLQLRILGPRSDGYHDIYTIMQKISLCDELRITIFPAQRREINVYCPGANIPSEKNTAYKAAALFLERTMLNICINISIDKKIPSQAGLGGGSSDAAEVLLALHEYCGFKLSERELLGLAARVGADVPFFVKNAPCAICEGKGERVKPTKFDLPGAFCLIAKPVCNVSTKRAYEDFDRLEAKNEPPPPDLSFFNDFEKVIFAQNENIREIKSLILDCGAMTAGLSGSGSALFGIFDCEKAAKECKDALLGRADVEFCDIYCFLA